MRTYYINPGPNEAFKIAQPLPVLRNLALARSGRAEYAAPIARSFATVGNCLKPGIDNRGFEQQPSMAEACAG
jgi:hypothetical protein